jgi:predicted aldo/keto reductase-like oxidoreductase
MSEMKPTLLGFGAMRLPTDVTECTKMFAAYLESGGNYIDTAYVYGGSEEMLKKSLTSKHPRDKYLLADKMPPWSVKSRKDCDRIFAESLERCGVDYFDYYLVHSLDASNEKKRPKCRYLRLGAGNEAKRASQKRRLLLP